MKNERGEIRKFSAVQWALTNFGIVQSVHRTRAEAIKEAEYQCREPWPLCRKYMEARKVTLVELKP